MSVTSVHIFTQSSDLQQTPSYLQTLSQRVYQTASPSFKFWFTISTVTVITLSLIAFLYLRSRYSQKDGPSSSSPPFTSTSLPYSTPHLSSTSAVGSPEKFKNGGPISTSTPLFSGFNNGHLISNLATPLDYDVQPNRPNTASPKLRPPTIKPNFPSAPEVRRIPFKGLEEDSQSLTEKILSDLPPPPPYILHPPPSSPEKNEDVPKNTNTETTPSQSRQVVRMQTEPLSAASNSTKTHPVQSSSSTQTSSTSTAIPTSLPPRAPASTGQASTQTSSTSTAIPTSLPPRAPASTDQASKQISNSSAPGRRGRSLSASNIILPHQATPLPDTPLRGDTQSSSITSDNQPLNNTKLTTSLRKDIPGKRVGVLVKQHEEVIASQVSNMSTSRNSFRGNGTSSLRSQAPLIRSASEPSLNTSSNDGSFRGNRLEKKD